MKKLLLVLIVLCACVGVASAETIVLKAGHSANTNEPYQVGLEAFAKALEAKTDGKVTVQIYANNLLGNEKEMVEGLLLGNVDITVPTNGLVTNFVKELGIFDMPFLFKDRETMYKAVDGKVGEALSKEMQKKGFRLLAFYEAGVRHIMTTSKPINSIDDLKGMKIRTMQIPAHVESFNVYGAKATPLAYGELYSALQTGVVDGAEAANTNYYSKQFYTPAPYWAQIGWTTLVADLIMSEKKFQSFPEDIQKAILEAAQESAAIERKAYAESDAKLLDVLKEKGVTVTYPDPGPFRERSQQVYEKFITTPESKELLEIIQSY